MNKKIDRATHGPSWTEVMVGTFLSVILGAVLGAVLLVFRPVIVAKEPPKEGDRVPGAVYYIEGSRDTAKARQAPQKRAAFVGGRTISVTEEELNAIVDPAPAGSAAGAKGGEKAKAPEKGKTPGKGKDAGKAAPPAAGSGGWVGVGATNVRIRDGVLQVAVPVRIDAFDLGLKFIVQARGGFVRPGSIFIYELSEMYLGSCPVQKLPFLASYVREKFIAVQSIPEDLREAWPKLADVAIEGSTLKLTMP